MWCARRGERVRCADGRLPGFGRVLDAARGVREGLAGSGSGHDGVAAGDTSGGRGFHRDVFCQGCGEGVGVSWGSGVHSS